MRKLILSLVVFFCSIYSVSVQAEPVLVIDSSCAYNLFSFVTATPSPNTPYFDFTITGTVTDSKSAGVLTTQDFSEELGVPFENRTGQDEFHAVIGHYLFTFSSSTKLYTKEYCNKSEAEISSIMSEFPYNSPQDVITEGQIYVGNCKAYLFGYYDGISINNVDNINSGACEEIVISYQPLTKRMMIRIKRVKPYFSGSKYLLLDPQQLQAQYPNIYPHYDFSKWTNAYQKINLDN